MNICKIPMTIEKAEINIDSLHGSRWCNQAILPLKVESHKNKGEKHIDWETESNKGR